MKRFLLFPLLLIIIVTNGCTKRTIFGNTKYLGTIVEQNSMSPIPNLKVSITDGTKTLSESVTNSTGQFSLELTNGDNIGQLYIFIDGNGVYPSKKVDLIYSEEDMYDYGLIYLYNQTDASLYPKIKNLSLDYPEGGNAIRFKDVVIESDCSLTDVYVQVSHDEYFGQSERYQLKKQDNGSYSVIIYNLTIGDLYYFQIVASNIVGTGRSAVYSREYGLPIPAILELKNATVNTATIKMSIQEEPLFTLSAGLCWSTSPNPTVSNNTQSGVSTGSSDITITGLNFRTTTYYVRAYAKNANGIGYSEELVLPANNPYNLPTFTSGGYTYTYLFLGWGTWYTAYDACTSLVYVFDDWVLPSINIMPDFFNTYYAENGETMSLPVWSMRRYAEDEEGESETFMVTNNGNIIASKNQFANYYAVRKYKVMVK